MPKINRKFSSSCAARSNSNFERWISSGRRSKCRFSCEINCRNKTRVSNNCETNSDHAKQHLRTCITIQVRLNHKGRSLSRGVKSADVLGQNWAA